jgi:L-lactate utilization protein LutC
MRNACRLIVQLRSRWQQRQADIQMVANRNPSEAQASYEKADVEFRQEYDFLKQTANRERTRINELHENNLDRALDVAKSETNEKLITAWNDQPLKVCK